LSSLFDKTERVLATIGALALFTLNEFRIYHFLPHTADPAHAQIYGIWMHLLGEPATAYLSVWDMAGRWALALATFGCAIWALAETLQLVPAKK
jgi:hypothetical protein